MSDEGVGEHLQPSHSSHTLVGCEEGRDLYCNISAELPGALISIQGALAVLTKQPAIHLCRVNALNDAMEAITLVLAEKCLVGPRFPASRVPIQRSKDTAYASLSLSGLAGFQAFCMWPESVWRL